MDRSVARRARALFAATYGRDPDRVADAPGRVNLIGEHVDYLGGPVLPVPLQHRTAAAVGRRTDERVVLRSAQEPNGWEGRLADLGPAALSGWTAYVGGVLWALREEGFDLPGLELVVDGDVPLGAGLSSSAAVGCAVAVAVVGLLGLDLTPQLRRRLVDVCVRAETEVAGAPTGGMDQTVALLASEEAALLIDFGTDPPATRPVTLPLADSGLALLVIDTGVRHRLVDGGYADRRRTSEQAAVALGVTRLAHAEPAAVAALADPVQRRRARHVVTETARVHAAVAAIKRRDWSVLGEVLDASHRSLRDDYEVSCAELDVTVEVARRHGALGARMTGGGFGGSAVALVPLDRLAAVRMALDRAYDERGWGTPRQLRIEPGVPAGLVD